MQLVIQSGDLGPKWFHLSIRTLVLMAESETKLKSHQIAEILGDDASAIRKILRKLTNAGLVCAQAGRYGGYSLKKQPKDITIKDIYIAFDIPSPVPYWSVPSTGTEIYISQIIANAENQFQSILDEYTIDDLLSFKDCN